VRAKLTDIEREAKADKRGGGRQPLSLNAGLGREPDGPTVADVLADSGGGEADMISTLSCRRAIRRLTPRQWQVAQGLAAGISMTELSRLLHVPRPTLYDELGRIRNVFRDEGLAEFLP